MAKTHNFDLHQKIAPTAKKVLPTGRHGLPHLSRPAPGEAFQGINNAGRSHKMASYDNLGWLLFCVTPEIM